MSTNLMPPVEPRKASYQGDRDGLRRDIDALWRRLNSGIPQPSNRVPLAGEPHPGIGTEYARWDHTHGAGGGAVFVQPDEPEGAGVGSLWFDTDAGV